jgi:hypothetical protein
LLAEKPGLQPADVEFFVIVKYDPEGAARHRDDSANHFHIHKRAAAEPDELCGFEPRREIAKTIADGMGLVFDCFQVKHFAIRDNGHQLLNGHENDFVATWTGLRM